MPVNPRVAFVDVGHSFSGSPVLFEHLDCELSGGDLVALIGPSGSGKSTLLSILAGWAVPTMGTVRFDSVDRISWVFQNPLGVADRTAIDHVVLPLLAGGARRKDALPDAMELLDRFGLAASAGRKFKELSGGESQRLSLARAVAIQPDLLLVDEPTAQLDLATAATVNAVLRGLLSPTSIVVVATHDPRTRDSCTSTIDLMQYQES